MENKKHGIFNVFDLVLIGIALILGAILAVSYFRGAGGDPGTQTPSGSSVKVTYVAEFIVEDEERDMFHVGDRVVDKIKHYNLGVVTKIDQAQTTRSVVDYERGEIISAPVPGSTTLTVVITADARVSDTSIEVDGGYELRIGTSINAIFPEINRAGTVIAIERGQDE